jgi:hypothetical protein
MKIPKELPRGVAAIADVVDVMSRELADKIYPGLSPKTMQGACGAVSYTLVKAINDHGLGRAEFEGVFNPIGAHAWALVNGRFIVDLTYTQFGPSLPRVHIVDGFRRSGRVDYLEAVTQLPHGDVEPHVIKGRAAVARARQFVVKPRAYQQINERLRGLA